MRRTLLVTNDFPPRRGGIQSYLQAYVDRLPAESVVVYASTWRGALTRRHDEAQRYEVDRYPGSVMLPTPTVVRRAAELVRAHAIETVWFGAAAPLAVMGPALRRAGAARIVASTHGHEVGWSMLPGARGILRRIGDDADVVTYVSRYTRNRFASAFGPDAALEHLPGGVDTAVFRPDPDARAALRSRYGLGEAPVVLCLSRLVPRKGQDTLIRGFARVVRRVPDAHLVIVGGGPYEKTLRALAARSAVTGRIHIVGPVAGDELAAHHAMADVFAMPCRTRGGGLDVEGLGIVFLEAGACGVPVIAGDSGGAPETVVEGVTGHVVDGHDVDAVADRVADVLGDPGRGAAMGRAGRARAEAEWDWSALAARLRGILDG